MDSSTNVVFSHLICHPKEDARPQPAQRRQDCQGDKVKPNDGEDQLHSRVNVEIVWENHKVLYIKPCLL